MKKSEFLALISVFMIGFLWGIIAEQKPFFAVGSALGLVVFSLPSTLIIFLVTLLLRKIKVLKTKEHYEDQQNKARLIFRIYVWNGLIIGSLLILQQIFDILPKFI